MRLLMHVGVPTIPVARDRDVQLGKLALYRLRFGVALLAPLDTGLPGC